MWYLPGTFLTVFRLANLFTVGVSYLVCEWRAPETLKKILDLEMRDTGESHQKLLQLCQDVIQYSVKTSRNAISNEVVLLYANLGR